MVTVLEVKPGYGWGWFENDDLVELPGIFLAEVKREGSWTGTVMNGEYEGWSISLSARHVPFDGQVNLELRKADDRRVINGYATIPLEAMN